MTGLRKLRRVHRAALALGLLACPLAHASSVSLARHQLKALPKEATSVQRAAIFARHYRQLLVESPGLQLAELRATAVDGSPFELRPRPKAGALSSLTVLNESLAELRALSEEALSAGERATLDSLLKRILAKLAPGTGAEPARAARRDQRMEREPFRIEPLATEPMYPHLIRVGVSRPFTLFVRTISASAPEILIRDNATGVDSPLTVPGNTTGTPILSPDGETVYVGYGGTSKSIAICSARLRTQLGNVSLRRPTNRVADLQISRDGKYLFYYGQHGLAVEPLTDTPQPPGLVDIPYSGAHPGYVVSPDSRWVATGNSRGQGFELADLATGERRVLAAPPDHVPSAHHFRTGEDGRELVDILVTDPKHRFGKSWLATFDLATASEVSREELPDLITGARGDVAGVFVDGGRGLALYQWGSPIPIKGLLRFYERESGRLETGKVDAGSNILRSEAGRKISLIHGTDVSHYDLEASYLEAFERRSRR